MSEMGQVGPQAGRAHPPYGGPQADGAHTPFGGDNQFLLLSENEGPIRLDLPISQEMSEIGVFYVNSPDFLRNFFLIFILFLFF